MSMGPIYNFFGGTCRFYAFWFMAVGCALAFLGHLSADFIALGGVVQGLVVIHSVKEDYFQRPANGQDANK